MANRETKFRIIYLEEKERKAHFNKPSYWSPTNACCDLAYCIRDKDYAVSQCTGLKDKNGQGDEIYKDDIISSSRGVKYHVYWDSEYGQWWGHMINKIIQNEYTRPLHELLSKSYMKVIGNTHQNPELLET